MSASDDRAPLRFSDPVLASPASPAPAGPAAVSEALERPRAVGLPRRSVHRMPFGAELTAAGVRFRLWAPAARAVDLVIEPEGRAHGMARDAEGWAAVTVAEAGPGTRYRFRIDGGLLVPDPASRFQPNDVHGPSEVVDAESHAWADSAWKGVPPERLVIYEIHVGTFTPEGTFAAAARRLAALVDLGVTAVELMPVADFPGRRGWGYDGVLPFAPYSAYGRPEDLKALVDEAHARGLAVILDVVYNHFGPEGNYLGLYAPDFSHRDRGTPWGAALGFDGAGSATVRRFVVDNACYWLEEFHLDGLRLDAVHAITDESPQHIVDEIARAAAQLARDRALHLVLENAANEVRWLVPGPPAGVHRAQWNDDLHHALHVLLTGERGGYYVDYQPPAPALGRSLAEGFAYQGQWSAYRRGPRGEVSRGLSPTAFVGFLQNHDQVGNRAFGERLTGLADPAAVRAATAVLLLAPCVPLLFMGQEWGAPEPFLFFSDLGPDAGPLVAAGRRAEFARFPEFADAAARDRIPDPQALDTFRRSVLDWSRREVPSHGEWLDLHRRLLAIRGREIAPMLAGGGPAPARWHQIGETALEIVWTMPGRGALAMVMNLGPRPVSHRGPEPGWGRRVHAEGLPTSTWVVLPAWSMGCYAAEEPA